SVAREKRPLVLVVEDNAQAADLLVRYLDRGGYRAVVARDGGEALEMTQRLRPVAITLDILLPELDGWEVLNALKRDQLTRDIPVVVVSVVDLPDLGRALGALDYFVKPVDAQTLLARLDQLTLTSKARTGETRVLIVDDEQADRQRLARLLRPSGFKVLTAGGGAEGLELVRKRHPDLVLLDLMMPEVNGFEVVAAMKADPGMRAIPILIVTAKDLTDADKELLNGHVAAILRKDSLAGTDLLNWLRHVVNGKAAAAAPAKVAM
ncbi:MAG TPA: response regulator, partial [Candidatus Acidoferrales bacterium]|nr:response regulator [Candidatus Acidoferrales bacterium]